MTFAGRRRARVAGHATQPPGSDWGAGGVVVPDEPEVFGPGPNAPSWVDPYEATELFYEPIPVSPDSARNGFRGLQGFGTSLGDGFTRVDYPTVETPIGAKPVLRVTFPGVRTTFSANGATTDAWLFKGTGYTDAAIRVQGTWVGTIAFEQSPDGETWSAIEGNGERPAASGSYYSPDGTSFSRTAETTSTEELWVFDTDSTAKYLRARATAWTSGSAQVDVGMAGGQAPARASFGDFPEGQSQIYVRTLTRCSADWTDNKNQGTKHYFIRFPATSNANHYIALTVPGPTTFKPRVQLQGNSFASVTASSGVSFGEWMDLEALLVMNTPGETDGIARLWIDGELVAEKTDFMFCNADDTPEWEYLFFDPTFGGGFNPPIGQTYEIAGHYRRSAA